MQSFVYDGKFCGNVLIVGRTECRKTYFMNKKKFGKLVKAEWVLYILPDKAREAGTQSCFSCDLEFHYPKNLEQFEKFLEKFKLRSKNSSNNSTGSSSDSYGENIKRDRLIVMDNVPSLAD